MINSKLFYQKFQVNYFDYKVGSLNLLLDNPKISELENKIAGYSEMDYKNAIKSDIRQTTYQAIETVFEVLFALVPNQNEKYEDNLMERITLSSLPYDKIRKIGSSKNALNFLDTEIKYKDNSTSTIGEYIFYLSINKRDEMKKQIHSSIKNIKVGLQIIAKEFSDRKEYNSYKHGLRIIPALKTFTIFENESKEKILDWDLENTMTYFEFDKKTEEMKYVTKGFDTKRDTRIISFCSVLLWNMIKIRDYILNQNNYKDEKLSVFFTSEETINELNERSAKIGHLTYSKKPIKDN